MNANLSASVSTAGAFVRTHRVRLAAGAFILAALAVAVLLRNGIVMLALAPAIVGAVIPLAGSRPLSDSVERWRETFLRIQARGAAGTGKFARYFLRPLAGGSLGLWRATERISDPEVRAGVRLAALLYFWTAMIALLLAAVYVIVGLIVFAFVMMIVGHFLGWNDRGTPVLPGRSNGPAYDSDDDDDDAAQDLDRLLQRIATGRRQAWGEQPTGNVVDADGRILRGEGFSQTPSGLRIKEDGRLVEERGFSESPTGYQIDGDGRVVREGFVGTTPTGKRIRDDGEIVDEGPFGETPTGLIFRRD
jgi:hypothetical protein